MSLFRYALGRLLGGLLALGLFALFLNALFLSQHHWNRSALALAGPPVPQVALNRVTAGQGDEVNLLARLVDDIDVAMPGGTGRLVLLAGPDATTAPQVRAAILLSPADIPSFDAYLARATLTGADTTPNLALNGAVTLPYWIDRAEAAAASAGRPLAADLVFIRPFLNGREAGLAPPLLSYITPALVLALLIGQLWSEARRIAQRRRALRAVAGLDAIEREIGDADVLAASLDRTSGQGADIAAHRHRLGQQRAKLQTALAKATRTEDGRGLWLVGVALAGLASIVPPRPFFDALSTHLAGTDLLALAVLPHQSAWIAAVQSMMAVPGDVLARLTLAAFGPQAVNVAAGVRGMPVSVWLALGLVLVLVFLRRGGTRRSLRGHLQ